MFGYKGKCVGLVYKLSWWFGVSMKPKFWFCLVTVGLEALKLPQELVERAFPVGFGARLEILFCPPLLGLSPVEPCKKCLTMLL